MFTAAVNGNADVARLLIKNDADIDRCDQDGKTALMIAVINGHQNLVEILLKHEADIKVKNAVSAQATSKNTFYVPSAVYHNKNLGKINYYVLDHKPYNR